jgi:choline-sulfatase
MQRLVPSPSPRQDSIWPRCLQTSTRLSVAAALALLAACSASDTGTPGSLDPAPRSLLVITLDTTRADRLGTYGGDVETPHLDALASRGVRFERAYATAPVTLPAHASLFTGLYPPQHGVRNNGIHVVPETVDTLAERLATAGWQTAAFVSAAVLERRFGLDQGFATYDDDLSAGKPGGLRMIAAREAPVTIAAARAWLDAVPADQRFLLWVHLFDPHAAYEPPEPYRTRYADRPYEGEIAAMDAAIGELLAHPRLAPSTETAILAIGDHGEGLGEHGEKTHAMLAYDSTLRIPFLLAVPGGPRGLAVGEAVSQVDVLPTLLALLGLPPDPALPGLDLLPRLAGQPLPALAERAVYSEAWPAFYTYGWAKQRVLRRGDHKLYEAPASQLFAFRDDPGEQHDLWAREPALGQELARALDTAWGPLAGDGHEAAPSGAVDAEVEEKLRSLGYLASLGGERQGPRPDPKAMIGLHEEIQIAAELLHRRQFEEAIRALRRVLGRDPENLNVLRDLATALAERGRLAEAHEAARRALELAPDNPGLQLALATIEARRGNAGAALELAELSLATNPNAVEAWLDKAEYLRDLGRSGEASEVLAAAKQRFPEKPQLAARIAQWIDLPAGRLDAAEAALRAALERDPNLVDAWRALGETLERAGRADAALETYRHAVALHPADAPLVGRLGKLLASRGESEAEQVLQRALALQAEPSPDLLLALADLALATGRPDEARRLLAQAAASPSEVPAAVNARAIALLRLGQVVSAEQLLRDLLARRPGDAAAHNNLASLAITGRDWAAAERAASAAVTADPGLASAWNNLAIAAEESGDLARAADAYRRALTLEPAYWQASFNLGLLEARRGAFAAAAGHFERVLSLRPDHAKSHFELGRLLAGPLGDRDRARQHLESARRLGGERPEGREAARALEQLGGAASAS